MKIISVPFNYLNNKFYAFLGSDTPTGSIKDITVFNMLNSYKKEGKLVEYGTIIEATSGNTGISLSYYQKEFSYKCIIVMPSSMSKERREMIAKYGAQLILVDGGMKECNEKVNELVKQIPNSFVFSQFDSKYNPLAHYSVTGPYIYNNVKDIDYVFAGIGTGGTISGIGKYLKEENSAIKIVGIEPKESPLLTKGKAGPHLIQGIGANFVPQTLNKDMIDEIIDVEGKSSIEMAKLIRNEYHIDVGISSGAAFLGAIEYIKQNNIQNSNIVVIFPDKGDRYSW